MPSAANLPPIATRLLDRSSRGVRARREGMRASSRRTCQVIFDEIRQGVSDIECASDPTRGSIRAGATDPVTGVVSETISQLARKFPRLSFDGTVSDLDTLSHECAGFKAPLARPHRRAPC